MPSTAWQIAGLVPARLGRKAMHFDDVTDDDIDEIRDALYSAGKTADEAETMLRAVFFPVPPPRQTREEPRASSYRAAAK